MGSSMLLHHPAMEAEDVRLAAEAVHGAIRAERIVLFGSFAGGTVHRCSDIDLLIVAPRDAWRERARHEEIGRLYLALPRLNRAVDLLLFTPDEIATWRDARNHVIGRALRQGVTLYERS